MKDPLCTVGDVAERTGQTFEPGSPEEARVKGACNYVSTVLRGRYPLIPATPVPEPVNTVATEVTVRYLGADPATGGLVSENIGNYGYRRASGMGATALTDEEALVMAPYGLGPVASVPLSNGPADPCPACGGSLSTSDECFSTFHAPAVPLGSVAR